MFYADLHIHSNYSRATAKNCDLPNLALWAQKKGVSLLGTADFTHPAWREELRAGLVPAQNGAYRLRSDLESLVNQQVPKACQQVVRFVLTVEIATIYKKAGRTRKVHHLILAPDFEAVDNIVKKLERIGNLHSDGRPILGLDSRDLLEIVLESHQDCFLIPAHIWTPWFSVLGSKSGFDCIEDCYADLTSHIFALETGLSSDPAMNWRVSSLDRYRLISSSDAHSPAKLGREACMFDCPVDFYAIRQALISGQGYIGTVEFYPEEGKYHMDGHRKCNLCLTPEQTREVSGRCPNCGGLLTIGVMHRVWELADRAEQEVRDHKPPGAGQVCSLVPLMEVLSEIDGVGAQSKKVNRAYESLINLLGPELPLLASVPTEDIEHIGSAPLAEAISRLRKGRVIRQAGYDGEYGVIRLFRQEERAELCSTTLSLIDRSALQVKPKNDIQADAPTRATIAQHQTTQKLPEPELRQIQSGQKTSHQQTESVVLDEQQLEAVHHRGCPLLVVAGPGAGKTRVLTMRIVSLLEDGFEASRCLAITFTRRAANEMRERLMQLDRRGSEIQVMTIHSLGLQLLRKYAQCIGLVTDFAIATDLDRIDLLVGELSLSKRAAMQCLRLVSLAKRTQVLPESAAEQALLENYENVLRSRQLVDFDDLVNLPIRLLSQHKEIGDAEQTRFQSISIDEYQDVDQSQLSLIRLLMRPGTDFCAIGDPDQSIYGFRGADPTLFQRVEKDFPNTRIVRLQNNYRSSKTIVEGASQVIGSASFMAQQAKALLEQPSRIGFHVAPTEHAEAEFVITSIERMIGGHTFFSLDSGRSTDGRIADLSFSDFAVLYRTEAQSEPVVQAFARSGIPFQKHGHQRLCDNPLVRSFAELLMSQKDTGSVVQRLVRASQSLQSSKQDQHSRYPTSQIEQILEMLSSIAADYADDADRFLAELALGEESDAFDPRANRVSLMTLHASKGLEFPVVFLIGCEDGILPLFFSKKDAVNIDEERRLFYVGMTRARQRLYLCRAKKRLWRNRKKEMPASIFVEDIAHSLRENLVGHMPSRRNTRSRQLGLF